MANRGVGRRVVDSIDARSLGVLCFGLGIVTYWGLRSRNAVFAALVPLFLVGIAGLLLGYSTGYDRGLATTSEERDADSDP